MQQHEGPDDSPQQEATDTDENDVRYEDRNEAMVVKEFSNESEIPSSSTCCICSKETSSGHACQKCGRDIHAICGHSLKNEDGNEEEGYGVSVLCNICHNIRKSILDKEESKSNLEIQAKK